MPKTPNGKKRKLSSKKQKGCKPKRLKFDDKEKEKGLENEKEGAEKVEGAAEVSELESDREVCSNNGDLISERDIDEILEENASKNNLTATNVKSIIHHVLTDKRVLAMVQNAIAESEDSTTAVRMEPNFEPKMTRSKTKKSGQSDPISLLTKSPMKIKRKPKKHFMELELPEDSSDDEYNPAEDEGPSDDDSESCASFTSDLASPQVAATPERVESMGGESPLVTRSLSKSQLQDKAFKVPLPLSTKENSVEDSDLIAKRTRSQHSLTDTTLHSIEASFEPPDVIPELYEAIHEDDLDTDDIEWQRWLQNLVLGQDEADDDNEDTEYNFMAEDQKEEQEEYRNDRAVRIPQKEVNELITELLNDYQENEDLHSFLTEPGLFGEKDPTDSPKFSSLQRQELSNQLQMHVQLLTQVFLTSREEPTLQAVAATCREFVNELQGFSERASSARLCMALNGSDVTTTAFNFPGLDESVRIVNDKCHPVRPVPPISPRKVAKKSPLKFPKISVKKKKLEHSRKSIFSDPPEMSRSNIQIMATSRLFKFTKLLPHFGMFPKDVVDDRRLENASIVIRIKFTEAEDNLLALGLAQFAKDWDLIKEHLLPVKSSKQLQIRCKNLSSARAKENVVKHFRRTGEMWAFPKEIVSHVPFEFSGVRYGKGEPEKPEWLLKYEKQVQKEEQEKRARAVAVVHPQVQTQPTIPTLLVPNFTSQHKVSPLQGSPGIVCTTNSTHTSGVDTKDEGQVKPQISSSTSQVTETSSVVPEKTGEPGKSELSVLGNTKTNVQPFQDTALREPPLDEDDKGCANDPPSREPNNANSLGTTSESVTLQNRADSNTPSPSREKEDASENKDSTANPSKSFTSVKGKGSRQEKPAGGGSVRSCARTQSISSDQSATCSRKTSVTQPGSMPIYVLEPDPKGDDRAQAMAEGYLSRVKKTLRNDPNTYEEFLRNLVLSSTEGWQSVQIFAKMKEVLKDYPDLVEDFIAFLAPEEAVEMGVFMNNLEFTQARSFLRKLEIQFQKSPAHFQKIIRALSSWNKGDKSSLELYNSIIPLLKGQQHLIEEFGTFFGERNPPPFIDADFEEVELGSGSETEMDDFEEVIIPDNNEPRKGKLNPKHRRTKLRGKKAQLTKPVLRPTLVKNVKQQNTSYKGISTKTKLKGSLTEAKGDSCGVSQKEENEVANEVKSSNNFASSEGTEESQKDKREEKEEDDELHLVVRNDEEGQNEGADVVEQRPSCPLESSPSEGPFSNTTSMHSNDSFKMDSCEAKEYQQHDSPGSTNVTDYEIEEEETQDKYTESDGGDMDVDEGGSGYENAQGEDSCEDSSNLVSDDGDEDNDEGGMEESVSAKNLRLGQDGKLVLWTREDDRTILRTCQQKGATEGTFLEVSHFLENKSADEVRLRFFELMKLFEVSASDENERGLGESGCSSEEDEESGTCDSDQDLSRD